MGNCICRTSCEEDYWIVQGFEDGCSPLHPPTPDGLCWFWSQTSLVGSHVVAWLKTAVGEIGSAFSSVSGLSTMLSLAESIHDLVQEVLRQVSNHATSFKGFEKRGFDRVVWATRIFTDPPYYLNEGLENDIRQGRYWAIGSSVLGTIWNGMMFALWLEEQGCRCISFLASQIRQAPIFSAVRQISIDTFLLGVSLLSYAGMFVERLQELNEGTHVVFSLVDAASELLEALSALFALLPILSPLSAALLQATAAVIGAAAYFLETADSKRGGERSRTEERVFVPG